MATTSFRVQQIDHVELFVPDRYVAARWYARVLGLEILQEYEFWAAPGGPLMISSDGGNTKLALFEGTPRGTRPTAGHHRVAFRVNGDAFLEFVLRASDLDLYGEDGQPLAHLPVVDHDKSYSVYFCDPYGHRCEVTTYDYATVKDLNREDR